MVATSQTRGNTGILRAATGTGTGEIVLPPSDPPCLPAPAAGGEEAGSASVAAVGAGTAALPTNPPEPAASQEATPNTAEASTPNLAAALAAMFAGGTTSAAGAQQAEVAEAPCTDVPLPGGYTCAQQQVGAAGLVRALMAWCGEHQCLQLPLPAAALLAAVGLGQVRRQLHGPGQLLRRHLRQVHRGVGGIG